MSNFFESIDNLCRPHLHAVKDSYHQEKALRRNKGILFIELGSLISTILYIILTNKAPTPVQKGFVLIMMGIIIVFLSLCRSFPNIFVVMYFMLVTFFGPIFYYYYKDSVFFNSMAVVMLPTWVLCLTGSKMLFFIQVLIQNIYLHVLYKPQMLVVLESMSHEAYFQRVANITTFGAIINSIFVLTTEIALEKAHYRIIEAENKKFQLDRQKTFFLSFSHEIRNLIHSVIGNIRLSILEGLPVRVQKLLQNSEVCGEVLLHLVNNILDTGKAQIGELEIHPTPNLMSEVWKKAWGVCAQLIKQNQLQGQIRIQKKIPRILKIDNFRIMQILLNLVGNAIKFTQKGSISVDIQWIEDQDQVTETCFEPHPFSNDDQEEGLFERDQAFALFDKKVSVFSLDSKISLQDTFETKNLEDNPRKGVLKIIVSDTGCGIPPDKISKLFQQFSQVHDDPSMRKLGTGLGLFITKVLVNKMDGEIKAFSQPGKGSAFIVCIPADSTRDNCLSI